MLLGIIRDKTNNIEYYIDSEKKDNYCEIGITRVDNSTVKMLNIDETKELFKTILSSKLTFKEHLNDYDIYLDEANNKRYFKNGIEDYFMFINNNGVDAINYIEKIDKNKKPKSKYISIITSTIVFEIIVSAVALIPFAGDVRLRQNVDTLVSSVIDLETDELTDLIRKSNNLSDEDKEVLCNEAYFDFVLENSETIRNYTLRKRFDNIGIKTFDTSVLENANGYYNALDPNTIHVLDEDFYSNNYQDILVHEFIHMTQKQSCYAYIMEASDEMFKYEFYNKPVIAYPECVKRLKVLMEIIGTEPIKECNFRNDKKQFEKAICEYLSYEEAKDLLNLFCTTSTKINDPNYENEDVNRKIDAYLAKMYINKTGKDIKDDPMIRLIYNNNDKNRIYFNTNLENYYKDTFLFKDQELIGEYDIKDVIASGNIKSYDYNTKESVEINGKSTPQTVRHSTTDFSEIPEYNGMAVIIIYNDDTRGYAFYNKDKGGWSKVSQYKIVDLYEPSIPKKFPEQNKKTKNTVEIDSMLNKEEQEETNVKTM